VTEQSSQPRERLLLLRDLDGRHGGISEGKAKSYYEAACICLDKHHASPVDFVVEFDGATAPANVAWDRPSDVVRRAWSNTVEAVEDGAYAFALAGVELERGLSAVRRAETGTGADYYVAPRGTDPEDLEACYRLEVSGVDSGDQRDIQKRLRIKVRQVLDGEGDLPALAAVVGYRERRLLIREIKTDALA
jgi:hypothetical protein